MLKRVKINDAWYFRGCVYGECKKQEEPNQVPARFISTHSRFLDFDEGGNQEIKKPYVQTFKVSLWMVKMLRRICLIGHSDR